MVMTRACSALLYARAPASNKFPQLRHTVLGLDVCLGADGGLCGAADRRAVFLSSWQHEPSLPCPRLSVVGGGEVGRVFAGQGQPKAADLMNPPVRGAAPELSVYLRSVLVFPTLSRPRGVRHVFEDVYRVTYHVISSVGSTKGAS
jgi:hypothetical protein